MKFVVIVFLGLNCDVDMLWVVCEIMGVDVEFVWYDEFFLERFDGVLLLGGFFYGDYLRCGVIVWFFIIMEEVVCFVEEGKFVFGICNGFQILIEVGLLLGVLR